VPSSSNRRRVEIPVFMHDRVQAIARAEQRPLTSVITELLRWGMEHYHPTWVESRDLERFNSRAQRVLDQARKHATELHQDYVGTEHVLMALAEDKGGVAGAVLRSLGVTRDRIREGIEHEYGRSTEPVAEALGFTARVRVVLGLALKEAERMGGGPARTEHMLLALVRYGGGLGPDILDEIGVLAEVRPALQDRLGRSSDESVAGGHDGASGRVRP